nr:hypothetical protein Iba_chr05cCG9780 [Ipomoea batatas]
MARGDPVMLAELSNLLIENEFICGDDYVAGVGGVSAVPTEIVVERGGRLGRGSSTSSSHVEHGPLAAGRLDAKEGQGKPRPNPFQSRNQQSDKKENQAHIPTPQPSNRGGSHGSGIPPHTPPHNNTHPPGIGVQGGPQVPLEPRHEEDPHIELDGHPGFFVRVFNESFELLNASLSTFNFLHSTGGDRRRAGEGKIRQRRSAFLVRLFSRVFVYLGVDEGRLASLVASVSRRFYFDGQPLRRSKDGRLHWCGGDGAVGVYSVVCGLHSEHGSMAGSGDGHRRRRGSGPASEVSVPG